MTRMRVWLLTALVALALGINFLLLSPRIAQSAEETLRGRLTAATNAVRAQMELRDSRLNPRLAAESPDLIDALRPPADPTLPIPKPDDKALRAAAAAAQPVEPDLLIVATADGAAWSRRTKPAVLTDDVKDLPLVKTTLETGPGAPSFAQFDGALFRVQSARIPGSVGVVVTGLLVDDHLASELRAAADTDVTLFRDGQLVASSLPEDRRADLNSWVRSPRTGFGTLQLKMVGVGSALDGKLPRGATRFATRAASVPLEGGVMIALTTSAYPHLGWFARYQGYYLIAFALFVLFGFLWGLLPGEKKKQAAAVAEPPRPTTMKLPSRVAEAATRAEATLAGAHDAAPKPAEARELPWSETGDLGAPVRPPGGPRSEPGDLGARAHDAKPEPIPLTEIRHEDEPAPAPKSEPIPLTEIKHEEEAAPAKPEPIPLTEIKREPDYGDEETRTSSSPAPIPLTELKREEEVHAGKREDATAVDGKPSAAAQHPDPFAFGEPEAPKDVFSLIAPEKSSSSDPFAPLPSQPAGADPFAAADPFGESERTVASPPPAHMPRETAHPQEAPAHASHEPAQPEPFSFASMLDEAHASPEPTPAAPRPLADERLGDREETRPGAPSEELLAHARQDYDAGDEPTRVEAVSAALLDKLREKDEPEAAPWGSPAAGEHAAGEHAAHERLSPSHEDVEHEAQQAEHEAAAESAPHAEPAQDPHAAHETHAEPAAAESRHAHADAASEPSHAAHDELSHAEPSHEAHAEPSHEAHAHDAEPAAESSQQEAAHAGAEPAGDPDEAHFQETYQAFLELRRQTGEPADKVNYEKFAAKLRKNREDLLAKHSARGVKFSVYLKDGRAAIKASALR